LEAGEGEEAHQYGDSAVAAHYFVHKGNYSLEKQKKSDMLDLDLHAIDYM